jgi:hypothetical protein
LDKTFDNKFFHGVRTTMSSSAVGSKRKVPEEPTDDERKNKKHVSSPVVETAPDEQCYWCGDPTHVCKIFRTCRGPCDICGKTKQKPYKTHQLSSFTCDDCRMNTNGVAVPSSSSSSSSDTKVHDAPVASPAFDPAAYRAAVLAIDPEFEWIDPGTCTFRDVLPDRSHVICGACHRPRNNEDARNTDWEDMCPFIRYQIEQLDQPNPMCRFCWQNGRHVWMRLSSEDAKGNTLGVCDGCEVDFPLKDMLSKDGRGSICNKCASAQGWDGVDKRLVIVGPVDGHSLCYILLDPNEYPTDPQIASSARSADERTKLRSQFLAWIDSGRCRCLSTNPVVVSAGVSVQQFRV